MYASSFVCLCSFQLLILNAAISSTHIAIGDAHLYASKSTTYFWLSLLNLLFSVFSVWTYHWNFLFSALAILSFSPSTYLGLTFAGCSLYICKCFSLSMLITRAIEKANCALMRYEQVYHNIDTSGVSLWSLLNNVVYLCSIAVLTTWWSDAHCLQWPIFFGMLFYRQFATM